MKRVSEEGAEDPLYEHIKQQTTEKRRHIQDTLAKKCPPAPLQGMDEFFSILARPVGKELVGAISTGQCEFALFEDSNDFGDAHERPLTNIPIDCEWWQSVLDWSVNEVEPAASVVAVHGSQEDITSFWDSQCDQFSALRAAIVNGWNTLHPKLPASWSEDKNNLVIKFVE
jgi:hypothetical protein